MINPINVLKSVFFLSIILISCQKSNMDKASKERDEILKLHNLQRTYHFEGLSKELVSQLSNKNISVNRGLIKSSTKEENLLRFKNYFNTVTFEKWDDIAPPIIRFSDDFSLAYTIVNKEVIVNYTNENNEAIKEKTEFSWVAIYKKYPEGWKIDCIASTNLPSEIVSKTVH